MEYTSLNSIPHFKECSAVVAAEGLKLVELQVVPQKTLTKISAVIASGDPSKDVGVSDCSKAHRALAPKIMALLNKTEDDIAMEVCSPGIERNIKNAAEFEIFQGREVRVWDKNISEWSSGVIKSSDEKSVTLVETDETGNKTEKTFQYSDLAKAKFIHI
ncbi:ribosome maturation factor [Treponema sp.]|uniref:ribosome maturation factor n=1 Tax=Treponema sp. TaxID=166 RepID=UPI001D6D77B1|nr:ribosome maturation factor [Treponema sp.]MBS7241734.1 ribosome maturation factor [Treponema sp.]MCI6443305.1 ribosome maturation factor [Spirochaetia bacterium]MDY4132285.1 ribosome maturation factor [Treponema sp.]